MTVELNVRMEAVNLSNFVHDVHDLSTIRGGSFLLLEAVGAVENEFRLRRISTGASAGLFSLATDEQPEDLRARIDTFLHTHARFRHATFVVDVQPAHDFARDREKLLAMNRWRQFQQPTLAIPSLARNHSSDECSFDHVRPATITVSVAEGSKRVSQSVAVRRQKGRDEKQRFYAGELRKLAAPGEDRSLDELIADVERAHFANDLNILTNDENQGSLHSKMAIVYFDGNGFGQRQASCASREQLEGFDAAVKAYRRTALRSLLVHIFAARDNGWWGVDANGKEVVRMETLLWGGDELIWVVPSWKGWETVSLFYDASREWDHLGPLTHAGGLVWCNHAAPIHRMTRSAHDLAEFCKQHIKSKQPTDSHLERDLFAYQVFESFDLIGGTLGEFRKHRVPLGREEQATDDLILRGHGLESVASDFGIVRGSFPRSKLHEIVLALRQPGEDAKTVAAKALGRLNATEAEALARLFRFFSRASADDSREAAPTGWFHLAELWDYAIA